MPAVTAAPPPPFVVGLTGGIGSGKSAAAERFGALGAGIVDTDLIAHQLTAPGGKALGALRAAFGDGVLGAEGAMDRVAMRERVFADPLARQRLEGILHPLIRAECEARAAVLSAAPYLMLVVPLLVESGAYQGRCQRVCVVDCPEDLQVQRVARRNGLAEDQVRAIMAAQATRQERLAFADDVVDNSGDLPALFRQVDVLHQRYLALAARQTDLD
jgi:dephospho-CoA kinase